MPRLPLIQKVNVPALCSGELLIHFHIPKTGGTTFHFLFDKTNCGHRPHGVKNVYDVIETFDKDRNLCGFFSQEFSSYTNLSNSLRHSTNKAKLLVLFRTPLSHVLSAVGHMTRKRIDACSGIQRAMSKECTFYKLDNIQTTYLGQRDLAAALQNLENLFWIGITEHYDASICLLSYQLGQFNPSKCNCTGTLVKPGNRGINIRHSLPDIREVSKLTNLDSILYERAYEIFLKRVYNAEKKLGFPILCRYRDGSDAIELRDYLATVV